MYMASWLFVLTQGEGWHPAGARGSGAAGLGADAGGLCGHSPGLPNRVHALSQPVCSHVGSCAAAYQGE